MAVNDKDLLSSCFGAFRGVWKGFGLGGIGDISRQSSSSSRSGCDFASASIDFEGPRVGVCMTDDRGVCRTGQIGILGTRKPLLGDRRSVVGRVTDEGM